MLQIQGMTDAELEAKCKPKTTSFKYFSLLNWTAEVYGLGKTFRSYAGYPKWLPLFVYSDHGVGLHSHLYPHELSNPNKVHLSWHPDKAERNRDLQHKEIIHVAHPWISYRRKKKIERVAEPKGTLVFFTHHVPGIKWEGHDTEEYFSQLRALPEKCHPIVLCLHMHDVIAGHHKVLRRHGFPIVTAGSVYSPDFVDEFYALSNKFAFGTSPKWGSQTAYFIEMGIPYFFMGASPSLVNLHHEEYSKGVQPRYRDEFHKKYVDEAEHLFSQLEDYVNDAQRNFVHGLLGIHSKMTPKELNRILIKQFFINWKHWHIMPRAFAIWFVANTGLYRKIKKLIKN